MARTTYKVPKVGEVAQGTAAAFEVMGACPCSSWYQGETAYVRQGAQTYGAAARGALFAFPVLHGPDLPGGTGPGARVRGVCAICRGMGTYTAAVEMTIAAATPQQLALEAENRRAARRGSRAPKRDTAPPSPTYALLDLVGPAEIANRLAVKPQTVAMWKLRGRLPRPLAVVSGVPVWDWPVIERWAARRPSLQRREVAA